ncbi:ef5e2bb7-7712-4fb4-a6a4-31740678cc70 [Sclerotinia trifoliorum]|uniref:Ef5e2bb7-7712-4fb4-a6a4-31740678cc70 n=1 Tax=Sclerotinia trifoliorum TaxID=28548 RepID=A0A8H2ZMX5_9HELO|nr:ef5e2bb7-7712-4fb4-a6a4-31740678cc70 [Sclerotinia trifoliorum]
MVSVNHDDVNAVVERAEYEDVVVRDENIMGFKGIWRNFTEFMSKWRSIFNRETYSGSLLFNIFSFILPSLYSTLSKLWVANIDSSKVVTTDVYTYIGTIVEVLNEGLPRAVWVIIGDSSNRSLNKRLSLTYTLITFQILLGILLMIIFLSSAEYLAAAFVPEVVRQASLTYVRISSVQALSSAMSTAVANSTRALDHPDVPLLISTVQFAVSESNISQSPSSSESESNPRITFSALKTLFKPGIYTFLESALRNAIYLYLIHGIVSMGLDYATAWGVFNNIRWGVVMVPVNALEASTSTFVGHAWGAWRKRVGAEVKRPRAERRDILKIVHYALISCVIALIIESTFCIFLSLWGIKKFSFYLSESATVAKITEHMWRTIDWCYIFYALTTQLAAILLATVPKLYFVQSLGSNLLWMLPWAIAVGKIQMTAQNAWTYHGVIFGGALVFDFVNVGVVLGWWYWGLRRGKLELGVVG